MVKRKVDVINEDERLSNNGYARIAKVLRPAEPSNPGGSSTGSKANASSNLDNTSTGQRFGETTDFLPLTQVSGEDEDEEAANAIQGTQGGDDSSLASTVLYGMSWCSLGCP
jgi:SWI/SNF-related matrix-associated actin-dependent regulator of chromatin subfamily A3